LENLFSKEKHKKNNETIDLFNSKIEELPN
jgi:hypothetical protein